MKKNRVAILLCFISLGVFFSIPFKTLEKLTQGRIPSIEAKKLEIELKNLQKEKKDLLNQLVSLENEINQLKNHEFEKNISLKEIENSISKYKLLNSQTNVEGPGVVIKIEPVKSDTSLQLSDVLLESNENKDQFNLQYCAECLLLITNILNSSDAEAICINNERIAFDTNIIFSKNTIIINDKKMTFPFEIKCIGNPKKLEQILNVKYGLIWQINSKNNFYIDVFHIDVEQKDNIFIPKYTKKIVYKYAKSLE
ncbi:DUF881 domain-containing protein [Inediibacterium massiliense]|uniref:DUF881 domain-containing protein n=1 Tax=Inediibacterium massiliense TaxID=1658111 RepID=UPI0006B44A50|nr:DUF881 domain-containing protein [Inediibacterium massiliense]